MLDGKQWTLTWRSRLAHEETIEAELVAAEVKAIRNRVVSMVDRGGWRTFVATLQWAPSLPSLDPVLVQVGDAGLDAFEHVARIVVELDHGVLGARSRGQIVQHG